MTPTNQTYNFRKLNKNITLEVTIRLTNEFRARMFAAKLLIRLAA